MDTVLIADDTRFFRDILKDILINEGYEIAAEADDGDEAVRLYAAVRPDLVLMDILMPRLDGIAATQRIRQIDPGAKIVICSAMTYQPYVIEALAAGAMDFVVKPFRCERLLRAVRKVLQTAMPDVKPSTPSPQFPKP